MPAIHSRESRASASWRQPGPTSPSTPSRIPPPDSAPSAHPSPPVTRELIRILEGDDAAAARVAAVALGTPGNQAAVAPLQRALEGDDARLRMAAIRGLGRIATPAARGVLESAASSHADPDTRRRARAEASLLARSIAPFASSPN